MLESILTGFVCGAWAFLWCHILTAPGMAGNIVPVLYWRMMGKHKKWKEELAKPLFDCAICHSFWIALSMVIPMLWAAGGISTGFGVITAALFSAWYLDMKYENNR